VTPVFVVGPSRSGTNLVRALLNAHSAIWISAETHYFDDLRPRLSQGELGESDRERCERYFLALGHRAYGRAGDPARSKIDAAALRELATMLGGTGDAYFEAFCTLRARLHGKASWGEKTPRHAYRVAEIFDAFPAARLVCLVRDPRAVAASFRDWHAGGGRDGLDPGDEAGLAAEREQSRRAYHPILASLLWRGTMRAEHEALLRFGPERVRLQRFEELAAAPESAVRSLCEWLGLEVEPAMLEIPVVNSSYADGSGSEAIDRWRAKLPERDLAVVERCCGPLMQELGYEAVAPRVSTMSYLTAWATAPFAVARAALAYRRRLGNLVGYVRRRSGLAFSRGTLR
jgi:hypothetical protein